MGAARVVLHVDVDAFFCQVEALRRPELRGKPMAIQQHQDIIAANHAAKAAGVTKHMAPREARTLLARVGGAVVHVHCETDEEEVMGPRVSYRPYRETSAALMRLLRGTPGVGVVERASIDEAFLLLAGEGGSVLGGPPEGLEAGVSLGERIRAATVRELGLTVSVGVATNKLMAKLASAAAKPDGLKVLEAGSSEAATLIAALPITRLPGMGGKVAEALAAASITTGGQVLACLMQQGPASNGEGPLIALGLSAPQATALAGYVQGQDARPVVDKGPPQSFQVQMTLTPWPVTAYIHRGSAQGPGGAPVPPRGVRPAGSFKPLSCSGPDTRTRLGQVLRPMCRDLVARLLLDRHEEGRWPRKLVVTLHTMLTTTEPPDLPQGRPGPLLSKSYSASCPFPVANALTSSGHGQQPASSAAGAASSSLIQLQGMSTRARALVDGAVQDVQGASNDAVAVPAGSACVVPAGANVDLFSGERLFDDLARGVAAPTAAAAPQKGTSPGSRAGGGMGGGYADNTGAVGAQSNGTGVRNAAVPAAPTGSGVPAVAAGPATAAASAQPSLLDRVVRAAEGLAVAAAGKSPAGHMVTQVSVAATSMAACDVGAGGAAPQPITRFFGPRGGGAQADGAAASPPPQQCIQNTCAPAGPSAPDGQPSPPHSVMRHALLQPCPPAPTPGLGRPPPIKRARTDSGLHQQPSVFVGLQSAAGMRRQTDLRAAQPVPLSSHLTTPAQHDALPPQVGSREGMRAGGVVQPQRIRLTEALALLAQPPQTLYESPQAEPVSTQAPGGEPNEWLGRSVVAENAEEWLRGRLGEMLGGEVVEAALCVLREPP